MEKEILDDSARMNRKFSSYSRQRLLIRNQRPILRSKRNISFNQDQSFRLPTVIVENDPFLRHIYDTVSLALDDHPYPASRTEFILRTHEIEQNVKNLSLSPNQYQFLDRLTAETGLTLVDLWQGSHAIIIDNGYLYRMWSSLPSAKPRSSSHYPKVRVQQYGINFLDHQLLFGKTSENGSTWLQMEAHSFDLEAVYDKPTTVISHGQDYIKYRLHRMNVGPFGFSPRTEKNDPIIRLYKPIYRRKNRMKQSIR